MVCEDSHEQADTKEDNAENFGSGESDSDIFSGNPDLEESDSDAFSSGEDDFSHTDAESEDLITAPAEELEDGTGDSGDELIEISETEFPDMQFRNYVKTTFDADHNDWLDHDEIISATDMNVSDKEIKDLSGIEYFSNLIRLDCSQNRILELDLTKNTCLMSVKCNDNLLEKIELPSKEMEYLNCENNCLSSLEMEDTTIVCEDEDSSEQGLIAGEQHVSAEAEQIDDSKWKLELASALNIHNMDKVVNVQFSSEMQDAFLEDGSIIFGTHLDSKPSFSYEYPVEIGDAVENMKVTVQVEFPKNGDSEGFSDSDGNMAEEPLSGELGEGQMIQEDVLAGVNEQDAESVAPTSGTCGENLKWELDNGTLTIDGTGRMYDFFFENYAPWYSDTYSIKKVVIKQGVTSIGDWAFYLCDNLTSITIPSSVTSIGNYAFKECSSLTSITIPSGVTSIEDGVFCECSSLTSITIPSGVTSIGSYVIWMNVVA